MYIAYVYIYIGMYRLYRVILLPLFTEKACGHKWIDRMFGRISWSPEWSPQTYPWGIVVTVYVKVSRRPFEGLRRVQINRIFEGLIAFYWRLIGVPNG